MRAAMTEPRDIAISRENARVSGNDQQLEIGGDGATTAQLRLARAMPEAHLMKSTVRLAETLGYLTHHDQHSRMRYQASTTSAGWPDLIMLQPLTGVLLVRELKRHGEHPRAEQRKWLDALLLAGVDAGVWTSLDWYTGMIESQLQAGCVPGWTPQEC